MTLAASVKTSFRKYFTFSGRASRSEFWLIAPFTLMPPVLLAWISSFRERTSFADALTDILALPTYASLCLVPIFLLAASRLRDAGKAIWSAGGSIYGMPLGIMFSYAIALLMSIGSQPGEMAGYGSLTIYVGIQFGLLATALSLPFLLYGLSCPSTDGKAKR